MHSHAPKNYTCPVCLAVEGVEDERTMIRQADIFYRDELVMALINSKFVGNNPGHAIVVPLAHAENLYDLPEATASRVMKVAQMTALSMKAVRKCDGITLLQNNEPAGGQHAFHFHLHVFPRFKDDGLHENMANARVSDPEERIEFAESMRAYFENHA